MCRPDRDAARELPDTCLRVRRVSGTESPQAEAKESLMHAIKAILGAAALPALVAPMIAQMATGGEIGGIAGWVGVGLLGPVLWWLCYVHLPSKDKQLKEILDQHSNTIHELTTNHEAERRNHEAERRMLLDRHDANLEKVFMNTKAIADANHEIMKAEMELIRKALSGHGD